ncbi:thiamine pyrophosphate-binding protein [Bacillus solitudinis]|uniref:thiamine pyrophosphate-binding protein n=1 Tax=Bacillus solitudinis TaxID=2014074 RepID=UPI000C25121C|nr:thiamine pyrophosphate-binding protein [Bacillus solitudinis]
MQTVAKILVNHLVKWEITYAFGIPGKPVTPLILEMDKQGLTFVLSKHESGAGFEASGYSLLNKTLGVAVGTAGPGGTNLLTAAGQALATKSPVLFITGQPPITQIGKVLGQDSSLFGTDLVKMFDCVTKFSARVDRAELLQPLLTHAVEQALTGRRGPVHLSIPLDVLMEEVEVFELPLPDFHAPIISSNINHVMEALDNAKRPVILVGYGVHDQGCYGELISFAEQWQIPVMTTPGGKGTMPTNHPLSLGPFGLGGHLSTDDYLSEGVDLMMVIGSQLSDLETPGMGSSNFPKKIIHFDDEIKFIGKAIPVPTVAVLGNIKANLRELLARREQISVKKELPIKMKKTSFASSNKSSYLSGQQVMEVMRTRLPSETLVFGDAGSHSFYAIKYFDIEEPGTFFFEEVFATMGRAIGYAVGAKLARPKTPVVCLTGDGCLFMHGTEISTAVNYQVPVIFVVMNNACLDMVDKGMMAHLGKAVGTTYDFALDAAKFGESMGALSFRCRSEDDLIKALDMAIECDKTVVIEVIVDPQELPPTMKRG